MEAERKPDATIVAIGDDLLWTPGTADITLIAQGLGLDPVGADMTRITGLSPASLSRAAHGQGQSRQWRRLATLAATVHEIGVLRERLALERPLEPGSLRHWLYAGSLELAGRHMLPIEALSDATLCRVLLEALRAANASGRDMTGVDPPSSPEPAP